MKLPAELHLRLLGCLVTDVVNTFGCRAEVNAR